jgi:hypothetical protein
MLDAARARARRNRTIMGVVLAALALGAVSPFVYIFGRVALESYEARGRAMAPRIPASERAKAQEAARVALKAIKERSLAFEAATSPSALQALAPGRASCSTTLLAPTHTAAASYVTHGSIDGNYFGAWTISRIGPHADSDVGDPFRVGPGARGRRRGSADGASGDEAVVRAFEAKLAAGTAEHSELEAVRGFARPADSGSVVLFDVDQEKAPVPLAFGPSPTYSGGHVSGHAYLYDRGSARVRCVADVEASNSDSVDLRYFSQGIMDDGARNAALRAALVRDLEVQTRVAIAASLREAAPRAAVVEQDDEP